MTTWMRTLHNLQPKLSLIKATTTTRSSGTSAATATATGNGHQDAARRSQSASIFLNEFLELGGPCRSATSTSWSDEIRSLVPVSVLVPTQSSSSSSSTTTECCHSYDPRLRGMITTKPRALSADDIILSSREIISFDDADCDYRASSSLSLSMDDVLLPDSIDCWHRQSTPPLSDYEASMILSFSSNAKSEKVDPTGKPTEEHLQKILLKLSEDLPRFFTKSPDYSIYHHNLVFQNNIRGVTTYGLPNYMRQMNILRIIGYIKFTYIEMEVLKVTKHSEDGTVRVRWRIQGTPAYKVLLQPWKLPLWRNKGTMADWYDAFSTFYVGGDGLVHSHVCDKMMPDEQKDEKMLSKTNLAAKLALLLGAIPRPSADDLGAMIMVLSRLPQLPDRQLSTTTAGVTSTGTD